MTDPLQKIFKTGLIISGDPESRGKLFKMDTIEYEGKMWLVPEWIDMRTEGYSMPVRIVCLDTLRHQPSQTKSLDFLLNDPIPKAVLDGQIPPQSEADYLVLERPDIRVRDRRAFH